MAYRSEVRLLCAPYPQLFGISPILSVNSPPHPINFTGMNALFWTTALSHESLPSRSISDTLWPLEVAQGFPSSPGDFSNRLISLPFPTERVLKSWRLRTKLDLSPRQWSYGWEEMSRVWMWPGFSFSWVLLFVCILTIRVVRVKPHIGPAVRGPRDLTLGFGLEEKNGVITFYFLRDDTRQEYGAKVWVRNKACSLCPPTSGACGNNKQQVKYWSFVILDKFISTDT